MYHFDISDQRKPQGYIPCIALTTGRYHDIALWLTQYHDNIIALTTTAFDAEAVIPKTAYKCGPHKCQDEKSCEIKGGNQQMTATMLMSLMITCY